MNVSHTMLTCFIRATSCGKPLCAPPETLGESVARFRLATTVIQPWPQKICSPTMSWGPAEVFTNDSRSLLSGGANWASDAQLAAPPHCRTPGTPSNLDWDNTQVAPSNTKKKQQKVLVLTLTQHPACWCLGCPASHPSLVLFDLQCG